MTTRLIANALSARLKQSMVVDNRAGAGGAIGAQAVAEAPGDGYTLFYGTTGALAINPYLYLKLRYDPSTDFGPISCANRASSPSESGRAIPVEIIEP